MARFAVKAAVRCASVPFRTSLRSSFRLVADPPIDGDDHQDTIAAEDDGTPVWWLMERYVTQGQADLIRDRFRSLFTDSRVLTGSRVQAHRCLHGMDPPGPCAVGAEWVKQPGGTLLRMV